MHQLKEASALMDELCPSLPTMARGASQSGNKEQQTVASGETVMARCVSAALATGVDCVLAEEFAESREPGRHWGFEPVNLILIVRNAVRIFHVCRLDHSLCTLRSQPGALGRRVPFVSAGQRFLSDLLIFVSMLVAVGIEVK